MCVRAAIERTHYSQAHTIQFRIGILPNRRGKIYVIQCDMCRVVVSNAMTNLRQHAIFHHH